MTELNESDWNAIRIGPNIVGWVGPEIGRARRITVVMGDSHYHFNPRQFSHHYLDDPDLHVATLSNLFGYRRYVAVPVPVNSLDITDAGQIDFTMRSGKTLMAALHNFYKALTIEIQADLHTRTPIEAVRKVSELIHSCYTLAPEEKLMWKGNSLDEILEQETTMKVKIVMPVGFDSCYKGFLGVQELSRTRTEGLVGSTGFGLFVDWQLRSGFAAWRAIPENVIHVRAASLEEYETAERFFATGNRLEQYITKTLPEATEASVFLSMIGDPLEEWVDGETVTVEEFLAVTSKE